MCRSLSTLSRGLNCSLLPRLSILHQSPSGIPMPLRLTQTCHQDGWECETHLARTTGTSQPVPLSGSLRRLLAKSAAPWCRRLCPLRRLPARSPRWGPLRHSGWGWSHRAHACLSASLYSPGIVGSTLRHRRRHQWRGTVESECQSKSLKVLRL